MVGKKRIQSIGPATRCDEMGHFPVILEALGPSQPIAEHCNCLMQIAAVWPVSYP